MINRTEVAAAAGAREIARPLSVKGVGTSEHALFWKIIFRLFAC